MVIETRNPSLPPATQGIFDVLGYIPTCGEVGCKCGGSLHKAGQVAIFLYEGRFILVTGGLQSGKTELAVKKFIILWNLDIARWQPCVEEGRIPANCRKGHHEGPKYEHLINGKCDPTLLYWLVGSEYVMCEEEFVRIYQDLVELGLPAYKSARVDTPGHIQVRIDGEKIARMRIDVKSESRPDRAFSRVSPTGILSCESGQISFSTYQHLNSRTIGRNAWLMLIGTIEKAQPWFPSMSGAWALGEDDRQSFQLPTWTNTFLFPLGEDSPEIVRMKAENTDDFYMERIAGKSVPPEGIRFKEFNIGIHIQDDVRYIPGEKVYLWVDPGYQRGEAAYAVEIYHKIQGQYRGFAEFHEYEMTHTEVIDWCTQQPWWIEDKYISIDPFYKDAHPANKSPAEVWREESGLVCSINNQRAGVNEQDDRLDQYLHVNPLTKKPGIVWSPECTGIMSEFGAVPSPHSYREGRPGEILPYVWKLDSSGNHLGRSPLSKHCDGIRATEAGLIDNEGMPNRGQQGGVTFRGGQKLNRNRRRLGKRPHERLATPR